MIATTRWTTERKKKNRPGRIAVGFRAGLLALLAILAAPLVAANPVSAGLRGLKEGDPAPDFTLADTAGKSFQLSRHAGITVVLLFWASSNKMSRPALAAFEKLAANHKGDAVFVAVKETIEKKKSEGGARATSGQPTRVLQDAKRAVFGKYGIIALPSTCVIAPDGRLAKYFPLYDDRYPVLVDAAIRLAEGKIKPDQWEKIAHPINRKLDPATLRAARLTRLAGRYYERDAWKMAEEGCRKALAQKKNYPPAWVGLGYALIKQGKPKQALQALDHAAKDPAMRRKRLLGVGMAKRMLGKAKEAKAALHQAAKLPPSDGRARYQLGLIAESEKDTKAALKFYRKALAIAFNED